MPFRESLGRFTRTDLQSGSVIYGRAQGVIGPIEFIDTSVAYVGLTCLDAFDYVSYDCLVGALGIYSRELGGSSNLLIDTYSAPRKRAALMEHRLKSNYFFAQIVNSKKRASWSHFRKPNQPTVAALSALVPAAVGKLFIAELRRDDFAVRDFGVASGLALTASTALGLRGYTLYFVTIVSGDIEEEVIFQESEGQVRTLAFLPHW